MLYRLWTLETVEEQQVLWKTGGAECVEERSEFASRRCLPAATSAAGGKIPVGAEV